MSQHIYNAKGGQMLVAGYDRMLRDFFYDRYAKEGDFPDKALESYMDGTVNCKDLNSIRDRVEALLPGVPENFWECIRSDAEHHVGNRVVLWNPDGSIARDESADQPAAEVTT